MDAGKQEDIMSNQRPSNTAPVLDKEAALLRMGGDEEILAMLGEAFLEDVPQLMDDLQKAVSDDDAKQVHYNAHKVKGLAANFDARATCEVAAELEQTAKRGDTSQAARLADQLKFEVDQLQAAIRQDVIQHG
uniref:Hpt domain protein n=2 Tax=Rubinisphaera brasiliensis TaxID=119 RepID=F0SK38_RUBBR|nr:Hpt domain protein [Rubinisphaera brasiliensis DSM 5305]